MHCITWVRRRPYVLQWARAHGYPCIAAAPDIVSAGEREGVRGARQTCSRPDEEIYCERQQKYTTFKDIGHLSLLFTLPRN